MADRVDRRWVRGAFRNFDLYRVPVEYLILNADNRRFKAEKLRWEEELRRKLDPLASSIDELSLISILLDENQRVADDSVVGKPGKDAVALMDDWKVRGQEQPLWIRPDGYVANGNRRLAALRRLANERGNAAGLFGFVEVIVLEYDDIDDQTLFQMEAREQLTEGFKVRYGDLNTLLTLKEAAERQGLDWTDARSIDAAASKIQDLVGNNASYAAVQLRAIRYMDEYLEYTGEPGQYQRMMGQVERFRDIGKNMQTAERESPEAALDLLVLQFQAVQAGVGHMDMRELRKMLIEDPAGFDALAREVQSTVDTAPGPERGSISPTAAAAMVVEEDVEADDLPEDPPPPHDDAFPRTEVKRSFDVAIDARKSRQRNDAEMALRNAANRLQQVSPDQLRNLTQSPRPSVTEALRTIRVWVESVRDIHP